jgi:hypothetical protein
MFPAFGINQDELWVLQLALPDWHRPATWDMLRGNADATPISGSNFSSSKLLDIGEYIC